MRVVLLALCLASGLSAQDARFLKAAEGLREKIVAARRDFHAHPELSNREVRTGQVVAQRLKDLGLEVREGIAGHGVVGILRGGKPGPVVAYRADMDALPIKEVHPLSFASRNAGVMHACGHDGHMAIALGLAEMLSSLKADLPGTVVFLFQPAEEGAPNDEAGGAALMIAQGALDRPRPEAIFGLHSWPALPVGTVALRGGPIMASVDPWVMTVHGRMSHGGMAPHKGIDAVYVAAQIIEALQSVRSRKTDPVAPLVLSVGTIHGGVRDNILADEVVMAGTLRTLNAGVRAEAKALMQQVMDGVARTHGATAELKFRTNIAYPVTTNDAALVAQALPVLRRMGGLKVIEDEPPSMGAEDFAFYQEKIPGAFLWLGMNNPTKGITGGTHTPDFDLDEDSLVLGVRIMAGLVWNRLSAPSHP